MCWSVLDVLVCVCVCVCVVCAPVITNVLTLLVLCVVCVLPPDLSYPSPSFGVLLFELFAEITPFADIEGRQAVVFQNVLQVRRRGEGKYIHTRCVLCAVCCVLLLTSNVAFSYLRQVQA